VTPRRRYEAPPHWSETTITRDCHRALEAMVDRRLREGGEPYRKAFDARRRILSQLFAETNDLRQLSSSAVTPRYAAAVRYLTGPPVSADDLKTFATSVRFKTISEPKRTAEIVASLLDLLRFPWISRQRGPTSVERDRAIQWTAGLWAVEAIRTGRRSDESRNQERTVRSLVERAGFRPHRSRRAHRPDEIPVGAFTGELSLGGPKADVCARLRDGRLLAIECKVSNSELNSVKRLLREVGGKARQWQALFGTQVVTAAVLRGVFRPANVFEAQEDYSVAVFWEHHLGPLREFLGRAE